jgi:hypothetical protein
MSSRRPAFSAPSSHDHPADCCRVDDEMVSLEFAPIVGLDSSTGERYFL